MEGGAPAGRKQEWRVSIRGADAREQKSPEDAGPPHDGHRSSRQRGGNPRCVPPSDRAAKRVTRTELQGRQKNARLSLETGTPRGRGPGASQDAGFQAPARTRADTDPRLGLSKCHRWRTRGDRVCSVPPRDRTRWQRQEQEGRPLNSQGPHVTVPEDRGQRNTAQQSLRAPSGTKGRALPKPPTSWAHRASGKSVSKATLHDPIHSASPRRQNHRDGE